jgi:hypothetical protein
VLDIPSGNQDGAAVREGLEQLVRQVWKAETGRDLETIPEGLGKFEMADDRYSIGLALQQIAPFVRTGQNLPARFAVPFIRGSATAAPCGHKRPADPSTAEASPVTIPIGGTPVPVPHRAYCPHCKSWIRKGDVAVRTDGGAYKHVAC